MELNGKALSASMINTFLECPRKFQKRYVEKQRVSKATDHLPMGTAFHQAMEEANTALKKGGPCHKFTKKQKEEFLQTYRRLAVKLGLANMNAFAEGLDLVSKSLERMDKRKIVLGVEMEFNIVTPDGVPIMGYIDSVEQISDTEVLINDYKTSRIAKSTEEAREDIQLAMYDYAASVLFYQFPTVWVQLDYIRHDKPPVRIKRTRDQRQNFLKFLKAVYDEMLAFNPDPDIAGRLNENCAYCDYNEGCKEYVAQISSYQFNLKPVEKMQAEELVTELDKNNCALKAIKARDDQVKLRILHLMDSVEEPVRNDSKEVYLMQGTTREQDIDTVVSCIPVEKMVEYGIISKINNKGLDAYFQDNPDKDVQMLIDSKAQVKFNNPSIRTKKVK